MKIPCHFAPDIKSSVDEARVVQLYRNTNKLFGPTKPTKSDIGRSRGGKQDRIVKSEQLRNFFLQFILVIRCSAQQRYSARTYTALLDYFDSFLTAAAGQIVAFR